MGRSVAENCGFYWREKVEKVEIDLEAIGRVLNGAYSPAGLLFRDPGL